MSRLIGHPRGAATADADADRDADAIRDRNRTHPRQLPLQCRHSPEGRAASFVKEAVLGQEHIALAGADQQLRTPPPTPPPRRRSAPTVEDAPMAITSRMGLLLPSPPGRGYDVARREKCIV